MLSRSRTLKSEYFKTTYTYDALNRLTLLEKNLNAVLFERQEFAYDDNGNQLLTTRTTFTDGIPGTPVVTQQNTYDLRNQLIRTVTENGTIVDNVYNGDGLRVEKIVNGTSTRYLYEYQRVVLEQNSLGNVTGRNVYGTNLLMRTVGADAFFYMYNAHADVTALLSTSGTIIATYYYDAFGNILEQTGSAGNSILFAGYQYDAETGMYYLNARMYDPVTARFMQEDTYTGQNKDPLSLNLYTYCHNEPLMYSDPTGHKEVEDTGPTAGIPWEVWQKLLEIEKQKKADKKQKDTEEKRQKTENYNKYKRKEHTLLSLLEDYPEIEPVFTSMLADSKNVEKDIDRILKYAQTQVAKINATEAERLAAIDRTIKAKQSVVDNVGYNYDEKTWPVEDGDPKIVDQYKYIYNNTDPNFGVDDILIEIFETTPDLTQYEIDFILTSVTWLGTPYAWNGPEKNIYCDCGGFARGLFEELKYSIGWNGNSGNQLNKDGSIGRTSNEMWTAMPMEGSRYDINGGYTGEIIVNNPYREVEYSINGKGTVKRESSPKLVTSRDPESWDWSSLRPGDVIFFDLKGDHISDKNYKASDGYVDHVAIYLGGNYMIQTWSDDTNLVITTITEDLSLSSKKYIVGVKRYLPQD